MRRFLLVTSALSLTCISAASVLPVSVQAAGTKRVDPFLRKAIEETAVTGTAEEAKAMPQDFMSPPAQNAPNKLLKDLTPMPPADLADVEEDLAQMEAKEFEGFVPSPPRDLDLPAPESHMVEKDVIRDMKGYKFGSFRFLPSFTAELRHDDNIQAVPTGEKDDFITEIRPLIRAELEDSPHEVAFETGYRGNFYLDHDGENTHDFHILTEGRFETAKNVHLPFKVALIRDHEDREDDLTQQLPTDKIRNSNVVLGGGVEVFDKTGKMGIALLGRYLRERFDDESDASGVNVIRSDADRDTWEGEARLSYNLTDEKQAYFSGIVGNREYERRNYEGGGFNGAFRDGDFYEFRLGFVSENEGFVTGEINFGYKDWDHDSTVLGDSDDFVFHADLDMNISPETTISLLYDRDFFEDDEVIQTARITEGRLALDHKFTDKITAGIAGTYEELMFDFSPREDDTYGLGIYADYMINDKFSAGLEYRVESADSTGTAFEYDKQVITARVKGDL